MDKNWTRNPSLQNIDPAKIEMLLKAHRARKRKSQKGSPSFPYSPSPVQSKKNECPSLPRRRSHPSSSAETGKSPAEVQKIRQLRGLASHFFLEALTRFTRIPTDSATSLSISMLVGEAAPDEPVYFSRPIPYCPDPDGGREEDSSPHTL